MSNTTSDCNVIESTIVRADNSMQCYVHPTPITNELDLNVALKKQSQMPNLLIGQVIKDLGYIDQEQLDKALEIKKSSPEKTIGVILKDIGSISDKQLRFALSRKFGYPIVDVEVFQAQSEALGYIPLENAIKWEALPIAINNGILIVAVDCPILQSEISDLLQKQLGCKVRLCQQRSADFINVIEHQYQNFDLRSNQLHSSFDIQSKTKNLNEKNNENIDLVDSILINASLQLATEIHIEVNSDRKVSPVRFKVNGRLKKAYELKGQHRNAVVDRIKFMANMEIGERSIGQEGVIEFKHKSLPSGLHLLATTIPTSEGKEDIVLNIQKTPEVVKLESLNILNNNLEVLEEMVDRSSGIFLCVGPEEVLNKSTLFALTGQLDVESRKIWAVMDRNESIQDDVRRIIVNSQWTYSDALRSLVRVANADTIVVQNITDAQSMKLATQAALKGCAVFATLRSANASESITKLLDMGVDPFDLADSINGVLAQRQVRCLCSQCKTCTPYTSDEIKALVHEYLKDVPPAIAVDEDEIVTQWLKEFGINGKLMRYQSAGCEACQHTGYSGQCGVQETLIVDGMIRHLIQIKAATLQEAAYSKGDYRNLRQDGVLKVLMGLTTLQELR